MATQAVFESPRPALIPQFPARRADLPEEIQAILTKPLPPAAIGDHPRIKGLNSIKPAFVVERLIEAFGNGGWDDSVTIVDRDSHTETWNAGKPNEKTVKIFTATVHLTFTIEKYGLHKENFGGCDNIDLGDALKGARTDALTKIASELGVGLDVYKSGREASGESTPACPKCDKPLRRNRDDDGWYCWAKKDGCGSNFTDEGLKAAMESKNKVQEPPARKEPQSATAQPPAPAKVTIQGRAGQLKREPNAAWLTLAGQDKEFLCATQDPGIIERLLRTEGKTLDLMVTPIKSSKGPAYQIHKVVSVDWKGARS